MDVVRVKWVDSIGMTPDWEYPDEIKPLVPVEVESVGFLFDDHADYITLLQSNSDNQIMGRLTIPRSCISRIDSLGKREWQVKK